MSRSIRHAPRAFTSHDSGLSCCDVCHISGARFSWKDGLTLCKTHRAELKRQNKLRNAEIAGAWRGVSQ